MTVSPYFLSYKPTTNVFRDDEKKLIDVLTEVVQMTGRLYASQVNKKLPGGNFYPKDVPKKIIERVAKQNPEILSHFTIVEKSHDSEKLVAIPYNLYYHEPLRVIERNLRKAIGYTGDASLRRTLKVYMEAIQDNTYEEAVIANMLSDCKRIRFCFGAMEPYEDKLFYTKYGFQARVSFLNADLTKRCQEIKEMILRNRRAVFSKEQIQFLEKTQVYVEDVIAAGGLMVDYKFSGQTLPNRQDLLEKHGATAAIYLPSMQYVFQTFHLKVFESVFEQRFRDGFSRPLLERAFFYLALLHEISRFLTQFRTGVQRLQELYPIFYEMLTELLAIRLASYLLLKDVLSEKEFEAILILYICRLFEGFDDITSRSVVGAYQKNNMRAFVAGNVIMLNVLLESGSIRHHGGISWPNFVKVFLEIEHTIQPVEHIFAEGTYQDAIRFIHKYGSLENMRRLHPLFKESKRERWVQA